MSEKFQRCAWAYAHSEAAPVGRQQEQSQLYGLYHQATEGDIDVDQPGFFDFEGRANYQAWKNLQGTPPSEAKERFVALAKKLGYRDPGPVPVPYISDETWRREESWTIPTHKRSYPAIDDAAPTEAVDYDRQIAPTLASTDGPTPPQGTIEEHRQRLLTPPQTRALRIYSPVWPVCCQRLATLVGHHGIDQAFEGVIEKSHRLLAEIVADHEFDLELVEEREEAEKLTARDYDDTILQSGIALYHCGDCGSVYVATCES